MAEAFVNVTEGSGKKLHAFDRTVGANTVLDEVILKGIPYYASYNVATTSISTATANSHLLQIMAGASLNVYVTRIRVIQSVAATTGAFGRIFIFRLSTAGTGGTSQTPRAYDTTDAASGATAMTLPTVKGTEGGSAEFTTAPVFIQTVGAATLSQSILLDWDMDRLIKPLRIAAGTTNGICVKQVDAIAGASVLVNVEFFEANH